MMSTGLISVIAAPSSISAVYSLPFTIMLTVPVALGEIVTVTILS